LQFTIQIDVVSDRIRLSGHYDDLAFFVDLDPSNVNASGDGG
jgi:hypothetical protein